MTNRWLIVVSILALSPPAGSALARAAAPSVESVQGTQIVGATPGGQPGGGRGRLVIGPPAPVPPEVAIPRPTPAEREQVNAAVQRFIDGDKSAVQPLLKKFESLMLSAG